MTPAAVPIEALWGPEAPSQRGGAPVTHEAYIQAVATLASARVGESEGADRLAHVKIVFGSGRPGMRGTCFYGAWQNGRPADLVEVCAFGRESETQLAGTTIHELAHVLAGRGAGHDKVWKAACALLGLETASAEAQQYAPEHFDPALWEQIAALPKPTDGVPDPSRGGGLDPFGGLLGLFGAFRGTKGGGCKAGLGTRGGRSTGPGSGRNRLWVCKCSPPVKVRVASDDFRAQCLRCDSPFEHGAAPKVEAPVPAGQSAPEAPASTRAGTDPAPQGGGAPEKGAV